MTEVHRTLATEHQIKGGLQIQVDGTKRYRLVEELDQMVAGIIDGDELLWRLYLGFDGCITRARIRAN